MCGTHLASCLCHLILQMGCTFSSLSQKSFAVGIPVGIAVGILVGVVVGIHVGVTVCILAGIAVGILVGVADPDLFFFDVLVGVGIEVENQFATYCWC